MSILVGSLDCASGQSFHLVWSTDSGARYEGGNILLEVPGILLHPSEDGRVPRAPRLFQYYLLSTETVSPVVEAHTSRTADTYRRSPPPRLHRRRLLALLSRPPYPTCYRRAN